MFFAVAHVDVVDTTETSPLSSSSRKNGVVVEEA